MSDELLQLKFRDEEGVLLGLRADDLADVLDGLVTLTNDFAKAGVFGHEPPPEVHVLPPRDGSFILDAQLQWVLENPEGAGSFMMGAGALTASLTASIKAAIKQIRAGVQDFDHLENGNVKVKWEDGTVDEIPKETWNELGKRGPRRKKALRQLMAPLSGEADTLEVRSSGDPETLDARNPEVVAGVDDYRAAAAPDPEEPDDFEIFDTEAQVETIDFVSDHWKIKTPQHGSRKATVEDTKFLLEVDRGLALRKSDIFNLRIREDRTGPTKSRTRKWTVIEVLGHRRGSVDGDDDD